LTALTEDWLSMTVREASWITAQIGDLLFPKIAFVGLMGGEFSSINLELAPALQAAFSISVFLVIFSYVLATWGLLIFVGAREQMYREGVPNICIRLILPRLALATLATAIVLLVALNSGFEIILLLIFGTYIILSIIDRYYYLTKFP